MRKFDRATRRHQINRLKVKRKKYWGRKFGKVTPKDLGVLVSTPKPCSCFMCCNRRKYEGITLQEFRFCESINTSIE